MTIIRRPEDWSIDLYTKIIRDWQKTIQFPYEVYSVGDGKTYKLTGPLCWFTGKDIDVCMLPLGHDNNIHGNE